MRIVSPSGAGFTGRFAGEPDMRGPGDTGLALPREVLDTLLVEAACARGAQFRDDTFAALDLVDPHGASVAVRSGATREHVGARLVIAADGLNSHVARKLGFARRGRRRRVALVTHALDVADMTDVGEMHVSPFGYLGLASIGHGLTNVAIVADLSRVTPVSPPEKWFAQLLGGFAEVSARMRSTRLVRPVRAVGPFAYRTTRATAQRILLVGDAADFHDPFTGEGIYAALRGGELAASHAYGALEAGRFDPDYLAAYDRARSGAFRGKWVFERLVSGAISLPWAFDRIAARTGRQQWLADLLIRIAGDLVPVSLLFRPWNALRLVV
jgi:flavin-dependent dehydrogenase